MAKSAVEKQQYKREWRERNIDKVRAQQRAYYAANKERERIRNTTPKGKEYKRRHAVMDRYGLALEVYDTLMAIAACKICGKKKDKMVMDHCHATGKNRGVLCPQCNHAIGLMYDSPDSLRSAANYLESDNGFVVKAQS